MSYSKSTVLIVVLTVALTGGLLPAPTVSQEAGIGVDASPAAPDTFIYFRKRVVSTAERQATSVFAADLDDDGDVDILSTSDENWEVVWFENDGNSPPDFTRRVISEEARNARSVYAADMDADGDVDVISGATLGDNIAWHENDGGSPPVFETHVVSNVTLGTWSIYATDVDDDLDVDILSASVVHNRIAWWESDGAPDPTFTGHDITFSAKWAQSVHAGDIDGDGDIDPVAASRNDNTVAYYINDGMTPPDFTEQFIKKAEGAKSVYAVDLDDDDDVDVVSAARFSDTIAWYENQGGSPQPFLQERIITQNAKSAISVYVEDVDGDGDLDVLSASQGDNRIAWYENDGAQPPTFTEWTITSSARSANGVYAKDVDGDGKMDALSSSWKDDTIAWYEHLGFDGSPTGLALDAASCRNLATGRTASGVNRGDAWWSCNEVSVEASSGNRVELGAIGTATGTAPVGGTVRGLSPRVPLTVTCRNLTTAQTVRFESTERSWSCEAAGLLVAPGHTVELTVSGVL